MSSWHKSTLEIATRGKGLYPFTQPVARLLAEWQVSEGLCVLYCLHTSASLLINESYDPSARVDVESFLERLAPEAQSWYRHTLEGADDSSAHLRAALLPVSLTLPIEDGSLCLGTWQGIYLFEHRSAPQRRRVLLRIIGL
ncbi:MAG TPA: secondary thiamine-phosphate synthase enzyme YjbQ [Anaerolineaceae bacterium]|nr:secondary thiamine-phosphate synthase enzyme YjbQ [Anaerolineaceae bacterium]